MGVDFTALIAHRLGGADLDALPRRLNDVWRLPAALQTWVADYVRAGSRRWKWSFTASNSSAAEELFNEGHVHLDGPDGFHATVHKGGLELMHLARWWSFANEPELADGLRASATLVARVLAAPKVILVPDSGFLPARAADQLWDGMPFENVEAWLRDHVGPPVASTAQLRNPDGSSNERGYLIEDVDSASGGLS